ncbi:QcrA and Rieske domain-containing protein [Adhaeretor mobilis]|uniref:Cytochrome b6-f complex iron-sulfur subunit n=1 Tax=Adhaeretor mobilis TaxID=1930276 RepID=A0A517MZ48_9BACT|nr:Rieske (2Fe-2S) protein [Adhaeretor mobilis]QDT00161.1 Cytochrome b6-f complex iron-sulfur subunit [Adhaeretor mobilis]
MADKKKMSVADMLAAARKTDSEGDSAPAKDAAEEVASTPPADAKPAAKSSPAKSVPKPGSPGRPSVADMLAAARAGKSADAGSVEKAPAKKAAPKAKPAAKAEKKTSKPATTPERDTASILAAARKPERSGPMSKAEAAAKTAVPTAARAKPAIVAPPMPVKPDYAKPKKARAKAAPIEERRTMMKVGFWAVGIVTAVWGGAVTAFMFPNVLRELPSKFKVGPPDAFPPGQVQTKFKAQYGVWVVNTEYRGKQELFALKSVCTHLGCTPSWLEAEQKFKCPCHGSGFYIDGINFEGPAPRPLERCAISVASDGQVEIDKNITYQEEMGQWSDPTCFISV